MRIGYETRFLEIDAVIVVLLSSTNADTCLVQRQTVVSQFFQLDRLVVEGQRTVSLLHRFGMKLSS